MIDKCIYLYRCQENVIAAPRVLAQMSASQHLMVFVFLYGCLSML